jgi:hypothetical protein
MKQEYKEDLLIMKKHMYWDDTICDEENRINGRKYFSAVDSLCKSKDQEVLESLLDFFTKENEQYGGVCESLSTEIGDNFQLSQLLQALYKKLNKLLTDDFEMAGDICMWFLWHDMFDEFREMFNTVKPQLAEKLLDEMLRLDRHKLRYTQHINLLRDDMKSW